MFNPAKLEEALTLLGDLLADRGHHFAVVAIGGAGLQLLGVIDRPTRDIDLVALASDNRLAPLGSTLPQALSEAVSDVGRSLNLDPNWMNGGPGQLLDLGLPPGFQDRLLRRQYGAGLEVLLASRFDQIHFKLYAAADGSPGGKHHADLKRLKPSRDELLKAAGWARTHDVSDGFSAVLTGVLWDFGVEE